MANAIVSNPPGCRGTGDFRKFFVRGAGKFLVYRGPFRGALKSRGEAKDFDDFQKLSKHSIQFFIFMYHGDFHCNIGCS